MPISSLNFDVLYNNKKLCYLRFQKEGLSLDKEIRYTRKAQGGQRYGKENKKRETF